MAMEADSVMQNKAGVGIHNANVEDYFYNLILVSPTNKSSFNLVESISIPPATVEFEDEFRRQGSFRSGPPPSPSPSNESTDFDLADTGAISPKRGRAATYAFKIRKRVGSSVSQLSRVPAMETTPYTKNSPAAKRKLSARRKVMSSPRLTKKSVSEDSVSQISSESAASDISVERQKQASSRDSLREDLEDIGKAARDGLKDENRRLEDIGEVISNPCARSANTSPNQADESKGDRVNRHKRARSSDGVVEMKHDHVDLGDIVITEKTGSPEPPVGPIDWEAVGHAASTGEENDRVSLEMV